MDAEEPPSEWDQPLYVAHHRTDRKTGVTDVAIELALNCNYDMLTCSITNDHFHSRVLTHLTAFNSNGSNLLPIISPLTNLDTDLSPGSVAQRVVACTSRWIDICSQDPVISDLSRQVLGLEIAYAAFCGVEYVLVLGPTSPRGLVHYARAVREALATGPHLNLMLQFPLTHDDHDIPLEVGHLAEHARPEFLETEPDHDPAESISDPPISDTFGSWESWNAVRIICNYHSRLSVALSVPAASILDTHDKFALTRVESRWCSEPIKALSFRPESFIKANKANSLALSQHVQAMFSRLLRIKLGPWIILEDVEPLPPAESIQFDELGNICIDGFKGKVHSLPKNPTPAEAGSKAGVQAGDREWPFLHLEYIRYLQNQQPPRTVIEKYGASYQDYLQIPLQPLTDNLESVTYEVFEKDPVKYELYEEAISKALRDWRDNNWPVSGDGGRVVVTVVGAGRGPLVTRAIRASDKEQIPIEIWAVEKNPNAYVHLQRNNATMWSGRVTIERSDMRSWKGPWRYKDAHGSSRPSSGTEDSPSSADQDQRHHYPVDILVSELLGSFADNELSPECLDGVLHLLAPQGISIPRSYTAYLTPISAPKLHADLIARLPWDATAMETPAVVWLHAIDFLSVESESQPQTKEAAPRVKQAWSFHHDSSTRKSISPNNGHNARFTNLNFTITNRAVCHGFGGYFESVLYPGVELSTHPNTMEQKSTAMISWFPIFFPLKTPISVPDSSTLSITMWRQTDNRKVWYEWLVESWMHHGQKKPRTSHSRLGISDLHSSVKNGCLM